MFKIFLEIEINMDTCIEVGLVVPDSLEVNPWNVSQIFPEKIFSLSNSRLVKDFNKPKLVNLGGWHWGFHFQIFVKIAYPLQPLCKHVWWKLGTRTLCQTVQWFLLWNVYKAQFRLWTVPYPVGQDDQCRIPLNFLGPVFSTFPFWMRALLILGHPY